MWLVFIESNTSGTGRLFAQSARRLGYRPVLIARAPASYAYVEADRIDCVQVDTSDFSQLEATVRGLGPAVAGITSSSEYFVAIAARLARGAGLVAPDPEAIDRCRNKGRQREVLAAAGIPVPAFALARTACDAAAAAQRLGYPVVLKPTLGSGSYLVRLCRQPAETRAGAEAILQGGRNERGTALPDELLVEEYVDGPEYSVEAFGPEEIVGITRKHLGAPPNFVEIGHDFPAEAPEDAAAALRDWTSRSLSAIGLHSGPSHSEWRLAADGRPRLMEINPRLAGGFIPELIRHAIGIDMIEQAVRYVADRPLELTPSAERNAAIRFAVSRREGRLAQASGVAQAREAPGVVDAQIYREPGQMVAVHGDFRDRLGHVLAAGPHPKAVAAQAESALRRLQFEIVAGAAA
jgi:biotin carboxylase